MPRGDVLPARLRAPTLVQMGFYADEKRTKEHRCPRGSYCIQECARSVNRARTVPSRASPRRPAPVTVRRATTARRGTSAEKTCGGPSCICPEGAVAPTPVRSGHVAVNRGEGARAGFAKEILGVEGGWADKGMTVAARRENSATRACKLLMRAPASTATRLPVPSSRSYDEHPKELRRF